MLFQNKPLICEIIVRWSLGMGRMDSEDNIQKQTKQLKMN